MRSYRNKAKEFPKNTTIGEWLDIWLYENMKHSLKSTAFTNYARIIETHIKPYIGKIPLNGLHHEHLQELYNEKYNNGGLSARTVRNIHFVIHNALEYAVKRNLIKANVSKGGRLPQQSKKQVQALTIDEQIRFIDSIKDSQLKAAFNVEFATGLRLGELLSLQWRDIDFMEGTLKVCRSLSRLKMSDGYGNSTRLMFQEYSGTSKRVIPIPFEILRQLKEHREGQLQDRIAMGSAYSDHNLVLCTGKGTPIEPNNFLQKYNRLIQASRITSVSFYALRYTFIQRSLEAGMNLMAVKQILGYSNLSTCLSDSFILTDEFKRTEINKLSHLFERKNTNKNKIFNRNY